MLKSIIPKYRILENMLFEAAVVRVGIRFTMLTVGNFLNLLNTFINLIYHYGNRQLTIRRIREISP